MTMSLGIVAIVLCQPGSVTNLSTAVWNFLQLAQHRQGKAPKVRNNESGTVRGPRLAVLLQVKREQRLSQKQML